MHFERDGFHLWLDDYFRSQEWLKVSQVIFNDYYTPMTRSFCFSVALILFSLVGCTNTASDNQHEIDASQFPVRIDLNDKAMPLPEIPSIGITEIKVLDSVMIVSVSENEGFWHFYSLPGMDSIGSFFSVGGGPNEFPMPVPCFQTSFYKNDENEALTLIPLSPQQKAVEVNLTNLLAGNNYASDARVLDLKSGQTAVWTYALDSTRYVQASVNPENNSIERTVRYFSDHSVADTDNEYLAFLNSRSVDSMNDILQLLTIPAIGQNGNKVAEVPGFRNQIVVYDTSGKGGAFITYRNAPTENGEINRLSQQNISFFGGGYGYADYFTVIRNNIKDGKIESQNLDFISWDGEPLGSIDTGMNTIRRFDIDQLNGTLYCLDSELDAIKAYNIKTFLDEIQQL